MSTARPVATDPVTRKLSRTMTRTIVEQGLIAAGDHLMVAISGGKDSYTLLDLLWRSRSRSPVPYELTAVHLDQVQPGYDGRTLRAWLEASGIPFEIVRQDTYSAVVAKVPAGKSYCSMCSRLRRGVLYSTAERLGCNKIALGHHRDDALETFLLNLFYAGKLQAMPARYRTNDGRFEVIRPLLECGEDDIATHAAARAYPIIPCNLCASQSSQRDAMSALLDELAAKIPNLRAVMLNALRNVRPTHLLDPQLLAAWSQLGPAAAGSGDEDPLAGVEIRPTVTGSSFASAPHHQPEFEP